MSRINYSEDEQFPGQFHLWQANCDRSLRGRPGQAALRELEAALVALPTKRLITNELDNGVDCCAIGAVVRHRGLDPEKIAEEFDTEYEMEEVGVELGMPTLVAWKIVEVNDITTGSYNVRVPYTPEQRYADVLRWVRAWLQTPPGVEAL